MSILLCLLQLAQQQLQQFLSNGHHHGSRSNENGSRRMVRKRTAKDAQKQSPKSAKRSEKNAKTVKNKPTQAKLCENNRGVFLNCFLAIFQWPYSGGHLGFCQPQWKRYLGCAYVQKHAWHTLMPTHVLQQLRMHVFFWDRGCLLV